MPFGYLVSLGSDQTLSLADGIAGALIDFDTDQSLGAGEWTWTGTVGTTLYNNETETGEYFLAQDGQVYFVPDLGAVTTLTSGQAVDVPDFSFLNVVVGTSGNDTIDGNYTDPFGNEINGSDDNADLVFGFAGNDDIRALSGSDTVFGGSGGDTIRGGAGNDEIYGDSAGGNIESLNWFAEGTNGDALGNFTQTTGDMDVSVAFTNTGDNSAQFNLETSTENFTEASDSFSAQSSLHLTGNGAGATSATSISFAASGDADVQDDVENVTFRLNDIDEGAHLDEVTITATDSTGASVSVTLTPTSTGANADVVSGNTVTAGSQGDSPEDADGSVLVEIAGPVSSITISYSNASTGFQAAYVTDVFFETIPNAGGNDQLRGGGGSDTLYGQEGDDFLTGGRGDDQVSGGTGSDSIMAAQGDTVSGDEGDDTITLLELNEAGTGDITIDGGEGDEASGDTLVLGNVVDYSTFELTSNTPGDLAGTVEMLDGSLVTFSNIENIICFTPGTRIATSRGPRCVDELQPGDLVLTRDNGLQPLRWVGSRDVEATGRFAPIELSETILQDARAPLLVSPQHRILWTGSRAQMLFGDSEVFVSAKHLLEHPAVTRREGGIVTYMHLMFDQHEIIYANGAATESFYPGDAALGALTAQCREEMFTVFPSLRSHMGGFGDTARQCLHQHEAALIA
ncbi:MAG: Hint domain-containing protein [Paracoccaceae bacterium]